MPPKRTPSRAPKPYHSRVPGTATPTGPPSTHTGSKATAASHRIEPTTSTPPPRTTISRGPQIVTFPTRLSRIGTANSNTPNRRSAAGTPSALSTSSRNSPASYSPQTELTTATPRTFTQPEMDVFIESELHNAIFHDPNFVGRFLSGDEEELQAIEVHCRANNQHYNDSREWAMPQSVPREDTLYEPVLNILNTIKRAVDDVHPPSSGPVAGALDEPAQSFINGSNSTIQSDLADTALIKPDLVLFQDSHRHWENVRMPIEVKTSPGLHKAGLKQLSRYARATFAHQLHRRHLYGILFCKTQATFVRYDRAGILYSKRIDLVKDAEVFTRALASLLMLNRVDQGFDPAFTFERDQQGRLIYYIDLPEFAFVKSLSKTKSTGRNGHARRFKVTEILCHRESICGRATIVLRIRELETETRDPEEYALKIIWRDPERGSEGEVLEQIHGRFGLTQSIWHCDVSMPGKCQCSASMDNWCPTCVDKTVRVDGLQVCDNLRDISIVVPLEDDGEEQVEHIDTTKCRPTSHVRPLRIYSYILMESIGTPLRQAQSPRQFLTAVLDSILGYWGAFNLGIMHRDISDGNVLMLDPDQGFSSKEWLETRAVDSRIQHPALVESEAKLHSILEEIGRRNPTGMLSDFDLYATHLPTPDYTTTGNPNQTKPTPARPPRPHPEEGTPEPSSKRRKTNSYTAAPIASASARGQDQSEDCGPQAPSPCEKRRLIDFRTGTPAFMSICVLEVDTGTPYHHHFCDDLESFFWLVLWSVGAHLDEGQQSPTPKAQTLLNQLNQVDFYSMGISKRGLLTSFMDLDKAQETLAAYSNKWALDSMVFNVLADMSTFLFRLTSVNSRKRAEGSPAKVFADVVKIFLDALSSNE